MESLFLIAQNMINKRLETIKQLTEQTGYIYKITNSVNDQIYIGSTMRESVDKRFAEHIDSVFHSKSGKLYKFVQNSDADMKMEIVESVNFYHKMELLLIEDYWIWKYKSREYGLNTICNTKITKIVNDRNMNKFKKFGEILAFVDKVTNNMIKISENYNNIIEKLKTFKVDCKLSMQPEDWTKCTDFSIYNPFLLNHTKTTKKLHSNIIGIYLFFWKDLQDFYLYRKRGGFFNLCNSQKLLSNILIEKIIKNGIDKMEIHPVYYIHCNFSEYYWNNEIDKQIKKLRQSINNKLKNSLNMFITNRFIIYDDKILNFCKKVNDTDNLLKYYSHIIQNKEYLKFIKKMKHIKKPIESKHKNTPNARKLSHKNNIYNKNKNIQKKKIIKNIIKIDTSNLNNYIISLNESKTENDCEKYQKIESVKILPIFDDEEYITYSNMQENYLIEKDKNLENYFEKEDNYISSIKKLENEIECDKQETFQKEDENINEMIDKILNLIKIK